MREKELENNFFVNLRMYLYVFVGVILKDGFSVGCIMIILMFFLVMNMFVKNDVVMIGEVILIGCVLLIGGVWYFIFL